MRAALRTLTLLALGLPLGACGPRASQRAATLARFAVEEVTGRPPGLPLEDDQEWHLAAVHVHTVDSAYEYAPIPDPHPPASYDGNHARYALRTAATYGVQAVFLTDHLSAAATLDSGLTAYARRLGVTVVPGTEWSQGERLAIPLPVTLGPPRAHLLLLGYDINPAHAAAPQAATPQRVVEETHARGGAVVLSPSQLPPKDTPAWLGVDLMEVDGPWVEQPRAARAHWQAWLMRGERVGAVSGAHWRPGLMPMGDFAHLNLIRSASLAPQALTAALRAGHVMVVHRPRKIPRVLLGADADGDGDFDDVREGDVLVPVAGQTQVRFQVRVVGAAGNSLLMYTYASKLPCHQETFSQGEEVRAFSMALPPGQRSFVRAELWEGSELMVLTNPLYFDPAPPLETPDAGGP